MKLLKNEIRKYCDPGTYVRANQVYTGNKILSLEVESSENGQLTEVELSGSVRGSGSESYEVYVSLHAQSDGELHIYDSQCTCPAVSWYGMCKHCAALCLSYADRLKIQSNVRRGMALPPGKTSSVLSGIMERYGATERNIAENHRPGSLHAESVIWQVYSYYSGKRQLAVELRAGVDKLYVIKNLPEYIHSIVHGKNYSYGKKLSLYHSWEMFDSDSRALLELLAEALRETYPSLDRNEYFSYSSGNNRQLLLSPVHSARLIELVSSVSGTVTIDDEIYFYREESPSPVLHIRAVESGGADLYVEPLTEICPEPYGLYARSGCIYHCAQDFQRDVLPFLHGLGATEGKEPQWIHLAEADYGRFCATVLPKVQKHLTIDSGEVDFEPYLPKKPEFRFYLSAGEDNAVTLRAEVLYGEAAFPLEQSGKEYRNAALEQSVIELIRRLFPRQLSPTLRQVAEEEMLYELLDSGVEELRQTGEVYIDGSLSSFRWAPPPSASVGVALHGDLIDITVDAAGFSVHEINEILDAYRLKKKYYRLRSGEFLTLEEGSLSVVAELSEGLNLRYDEGGMASADATRASYINSVLDRDDTELEVRRNSEFRRRIQALRDYKESDYELPKGLQARLRGYQRTGYRWLCTLSDCGLGGILADDMGLGKTVQMLAYFLHLGGRVLVVCPASLLYNWDNEAKTFAPGLQTHILHGNLALRKAELQEQEGLFITSYDQLRRDVALYEEQHFDCCVLDEAQYIRNAGTKAARAVKTIRADHRFALTGTPIENRLSDLWSIFDFLMPLYLYKYTDFKGSIEQRVIDGDENASAYLGKLTAPFILRRKKKDVLTELPDKVENVVYVAMHEEQRRLYDAQEQALRMSLQGVSEAEYLHQKIEYLSALTRLRQLCCTPELFLEGYSGGSGKVDACIELLRESAESGHRTLVFSQFTSMLELLIVRAEQEGLKTLYLSGRNSAEQRMEMVNAFQSGGYDVFFISLKAGGTGLNLTEADRVIHFDPWWNFAAEDQATDRTHRIGQKNTVFVTKLVCKDSIEERIIDLQSRKRDLSDLVIGSEALSVGKIDRDELLGLLERE